MGQTPENIISDLEPRSSDEAPWEPPEAPARHNPYATGALLSAIAMGLLGWVPVLGWALWVAAIVLSLIGLTRAPRWQAVVALVLTAAITVLALLFAAIGSGAMHSFFSLAAGL